MTLRVLTWNIHSGVGRDGRLDLERIARVLRSAEPDLAALTEVSRYWPQRGDVDQARYLAGLAGLPVRRFAPAFRRGRAAFGNALLSRYPLRRVTARTLPPWRRAPALLGLAGRPEPRLLLAAQLRPDRETSIPVAVTHLGLDAAERARQSLAVAGWIRQAGPLAILAGDFNASLEAEELSPLRGSLSDSCAGSAEATYPSERPRYRIDHILVGRGWRVVRAGLWRDPGGESALASDHLPVLAELEAVAGTGAAHAPPEGPAPVRPLPPSLPGA
ncbi:MAG: endonuclease/exonuclease/phosphatase family protein [Bacillota bacterium]|nr:endonuclease/exonuclease/phosphatase family protein [Bacillota bacterium]